MTTSFGKDISCLSELTPGRYATGVRLVAESLYRRLTTPRGLLRGGEDEQHFGLDLLDLIGSATTPLEAASLQGRIKAEALKDERIEDVTVSVTQLKEGPGVTFDIYIEATTSEGPFSLAIDVDELTVSLVGLSVEA